MPLDLKPDLTSGFRRPDHGLHVFAIERTRRRAVDAQQRARASGVAKRGRDRARRQLARERDQRVGPFDLAQTNAHAPTPRW